MNDNRAAIEYKEGPQFLFDSTYRTQAYSIVVPAMLATYLIFNGGPKELMLGWVSVMAIVITIRIIHCKIVLSKYLFSKTLSFHLKIFLFFTFITGLLWSSIYFLSMPFVDDPYLYIIFVAYAGMSAGSTTTLAVYPQAFCAYIYTMLLPVIIYNYYIWDANHIILASFFLVYSVAITIVAKSNRTILKRTFYLAEQNKVLMDKFEVLSITDSLTGLYNRRHFTEIIPDEYIRAKRNHHSFVLVSIDVDNFKLINDNFGHPFGDKFITYTASYLKSHLRRNNDIIFRIGGDEFIVLLVNSSESYVQKVCESVKKQFKIDPIFEYEPKDIKHKAILDQVSLSVGIVYVPFESNIEIDEIIEQSDKMLYEAKKTGKNEIRYTKLTASS